MKKISTFVFLFLGVFSSISVSVAGVIQEKEVRGNTYKNRIQASRISAIPDDAGICSKSLVEAFRNGDVEEENLPAACKGFESRNTTGDGETEIFGNKDSGYSRDGELIQEWGVVTSNATRLSSSTDIIYKYGPYDNILNIQLASLRSGFSVAQDCGGDNGFMCVSCRSGAAPVTGCSFSWMVTAKKTGSDVQTVTTNRVTYYLEPNKFMVSLGTKRHCAVHNNQIVGLPYCNSWALGTSSVKTIKDKTYSCKAYTRHSGVGACGYLLDPIYPVDITTTARVQARVVFDKNSDGSLKTPGYVVNGAEPYVAMRCPNWRSGNFSGCTVREVDMCKGFGLTMDQSSGVCK